ncbi:hypothetical protein GBAR_LOCUS20358, partial [Geodia barretti]
ACEGFSVAVHNRHLGDSLRKVHGCSNQVLFNNAGYDPDSLFFTTCIVVSVAQQHRCL